MEPILTIRGLAKTFGAHKVLQGINLDVHAADVVSLIGPSGSGKTTLLRCVDLLEQFDAGEIRLDGEPMGYRSEGGRRLRLKGRELNLTDGIKVLDERGWAQVLPDPDEPVIHVYAEGDSEEASAELETELRGMVEEIMAGESAGARA